MSFGRHREVARDLFGVLLAEGLQLVARAAAEVVRSDLVGHERIVVRGPDGAQFSSASLDWRSTSLRWVDVRRRRAAPCVGCCRRGACTDFRSPSRGGYDFRSPSRGGYDFRSPSRGGYDFRSPSRGGTTSAHLIRLRPSRGGYDFRSPSRGRIRLPLAIARRVRLPLTVRGGYDFRSPSRERVRLPLAIARRVRLPLAIARRVRLPLTVARRIRLPLAIARRVRLPLTIARRVRLPSPRASRTASSRHRAAGATFERPCRARRGAAPARIAARRRRIAPSSRDSWSAISRSFRVPDPPGNWFVNAKWPPSTGWPFRERSPAVSYSPTGSPLQYHRR